MALELGHEALAETHDFRVGLALGVEVGAALAAAHGEGGEAVLEGLLEGEELHDGQVDARMETDTALVGADGAVHLHAETAVDLDFAPVVHPRDAEDDDPLGFDHPLHDLEIKQVGISGDVGSNAFHDFADSLVEFLLARVARNDACHEPVDVVLGEFVHYIYTAKVNRLQT